VVSIVVSAGLGAVGDIAGGETLTTAAKGLNIVSKGITVTGYQMSK